MNNEQEILALAQRVFRDALPSETESAAAARRLERKFRSRERRRRFAPLLSVAFALLGAIAYAAEVAYSPAPENPTTPAVVHAAAEPARAHARPALSVSTPKLEAATPASPPAIVPSPATTPSARDTTKPPPRLQASGDKVRGDWGTVARSLEHGNVEAARAELTRLSRAADASTSGKAELELARLAAQRGECESARAHLERARKHLGNSASVARAEQAVRRCSIEASAAPDVRTTD
jgi:hypothetical protein